VSPETRWPAVPGYDILGELGRGGMGVVYKARQRSLKRLVALKLILSGAGAGASELARFRAEAEAAARLQHPNVVQVYEIGEYDDRPYLALEFVEGGSLAHKLARAPLSAGEAAGLVEILARAVQGAHRRGVIHRDLKPANVLLTADGVPKISDFGLAKRLDADVGQTHTGAILGTPSYMAPEQAEGKTGEVGPAADVYALGATLYELLTGRPPFKGASALDTLEQVRTQEPAAPRQLQPGVPRDLETICLKCLRKSPRERYISADELADDLRRFQEGKSVRARPIGRARRLARWCRRHPGVASLTAALVVIVVASLAGLTALWLRAKTEASRAERSSRQARQAIDDYFVRVSEDTLLNEPGMQRLRYDLLQAALRYYQEFLDERGHDPGLRAEVAKTHWRVGRITGAIGSLADARAAYEQAIAIQEELLAVARSETLPQLQPQLQADLAMSYASRGNLAAQTGLWTEARADVEKARDLLEPLVEADPGDATLVSALAGNYNDLGLLRARAQETEQARDALRKALSLRETLVQAHPDSDRFQDDLAATYTNVDDLHLWAGEVDQALAAYQRARAIQKGLVRDHPRITRYQSHLAVTFANLGSAQREAGQFAEARASLDEARGIQERLAKENPEVGPFARDLAVTYSNLGRLHLKAGRRAEALEAFEKARDLLEKLADRQSAPSTTAARIKTWTYLGVLQAVRGQRAEALRCLQKASALLDEAARDSSEPPESPAEAGETCFLLGAGLMNLGHNEDALSAFRQALVYQRAALAAGPKSAAARKALSQSYFNLAHIQRELGRLREAAATALERQQLWPDNADELYDVACELAMCIPRVGQPGHKLSPQQEAERARYVSQALAALRRAVAAGFRDADHLKKDDDLAPLRPSQEFQELLKKLEKKS
jgi:tetratricopeptide (TPR) repeat protein